MQMQFPPTQANSNTRKILGQACEWIEKTIKDNTRTKTTKYMASAKTKMHTIDKIGNNRGLNRVRLTCQFAGSHVVWYSTKIGYSRVTKKMQLIGQLDRGCDLVAKQDFEQLKSVHKMVMRSCGEDSHKYNKQSSSYDVAATQS